MFSFLVTHIISVENAYLFWHALGYEQKGDNLKIRYILLKKLQLLYIIMFKEWPPNEQVIKYEVSLISSKLQIFLR